MSRPAYRENSRGRLVSAKASYFGLCCLIFMLAAFSAAAQYRGGYYDETQWFTMHLDEISSGVYAEAFNEQGQYNGGSSYHQTRYFVGPLLGLGASGSVYHPNFLEYQLSLDGSLGWSKDTYGGVSTATDNELRYLGSFSGTAKLLDGKPFNITLTSSYAHTYQDYDFFNRVYLDTLHYGGVARYTTGPWYFSGSLFEDEQDATGYGTPTSSRTTGVAFDTAFNRPGGSTSIGLTADKFTRTDLGVPSSGQDYTISASDNENFGSQAQNHSLLNLTYSHLDDYNLPTDLINAIGQVRLEHSDRLTSLYTLNYARNEFGDFLTESLNGTADLRHQLFDSLTTDLNLQGYNSSSSSGLEQQNTWQFGGGPGLNYIKQLSPSSTVTAYESLLLLHSEVESTGGLLPVIDEQHTFGAGGNGAPASSFFLLQPNVIVSTIVITDTTHMPPAGYIPGIDYEVVPNGQLTLIQRIAGSRMPDSVLVSYSYNASPSGGYDSVNDACGVRFDFFNHHWGLYTRLQVNRNYGNIVLPVQNLNDFVVGTDASWRFIRVGAEYESYDSNLSTFQAARLSQNFSFQPEDYSTLTLNLTETFTHYQQANLDEENYTAILRYNHSLGRHWSMSLETGVNQMVGTGVDQTLVVFRPLVEYTAGSFSASLGYDFGYDEYLSTQTQTRNLGYIRLRKSF